MSMKSLNKLLAELAVAPGAQTRREDATYLRFLQCYDGAVRLDGVKITPLARGTGVLSLSVDLRLSFPEARTSPESLRALQATLEP